jgi:hypothetical protein
MTPVSIDGVHSDTTHRRADLQGDDFAGPGLSV